MIKKLLNALIIVGILAALLAGVQFLGSFMTTNQIRNEISQALRVVHDEISDDLYIRIEQILDKHDINYDPDSLDIYIEETDNRTIAQDIVDSKLNQTFKNMVAGVEFKYVQKILWLIPVERSMTEERMFQAGQSSKKRK